MKIERDDSEGFILSVSAHELVIINNALNEVCHALGISEFQTRMGGTYAEAESLLDLVNEALSRQKTN